MGNDKVENNVVGNDTLWEMALLEIILWEHVGNDVKIYVGNGVVGNDTLWEMALWEMIQWEHVGNDVVGICSK